MRSSLTPSKVTRKGHVALGCRRLRSDDQMVMVEFAVLLLIRLVLINDDTRGNKQESLYCRISTDNVLGDSGRAEVMIKS